jgi:hypothetical protein
MYSSKVKVIVLFLTPLLESGGSAFISLGGVESIGPPAGGIILAQPEVRTRIFEIRKSKKKRGINFFMKQLMFNFQCSMLNH